MSDGTRARADKDKVEEYYKLALENPNGSKIKSHISGPIHISTPITSFKSISKQIDFNLEDTLIESTLVDSADTLESDSDDSQNETITKQIINCENIVEKEESDLIESVTMAQNPLATLKYAVEAVPFFDGNNIPLNYFIEGCEEAKSMLPKEAESQFTKIIRTRIVGEARRTIQDQDFNTVAQLTSYLKRIYCPSKNVYQMQGELGCIYQKNEEDVVTYANRIKILGKQILEAYKGPGNMLPDQNIKISLEKDMNKCFIRGLKPEIEERIARNLDVQDTVADALRIERELRTMTDLRQGSDSSKSKTPTATHMKEMCQICLKEEHIASNCRKITQFLSQNYKTGAGTEILICQICKKRGHSADKCRL